MLYPTIFFSFSQRVADETHANFYVKIRDAGLDCSKHFHIYQHVAKISSNLSASASL